jgi:hypothetical protein
MSDLTPIVGVSDAAYALALDAAVECLMFESAVPLSAFEVAAHIMESITSADAPSVRSALFQILNRTEDQS